MKKTISVFISVLAIFLAIPASLILASWNSLPGGSLYPVKTGLEKTALALVGGTPIERKLEVEFVDRRFSEADRLLLEQNSSIGFTFLVNQAETTKEKIIKAQDTTSKEKLVANLTNYQQKLEQRKTEIATSPVIASPTPAVVLPTPTTALPVPPTVTPSPIPSPPPTPEPEKIVVEIKQTQEKLEEIIEELEEEVKEKETPRREREEKEKEKKEKKEKHLNPKPRIQNNI